MKRFTVEEIITTLIGNINPWGDTSKDRDRLDNIKELHLVVEAIMDRLTEIEYNFSNRNEKSIKLIYDENHKFLENLKDNLEIYLEVEE